MFTAGDVFKQKMHQIGTFFIYNDLRVRSSYKSQKCPGLLEQKRPGCHFFVH